MKFNNKHISEIPGVKLIYKYVQPPSKKKIKVDVPFMNGSYDFSTVGSNGEIVYNERNIEVHLKLIANTKYELQSLYTEVAQWLIDVGRSQLQFDDMPEFYFLAEVEDAPSWEEVLCTGDFTITFVADSFKMKKPKEALTDYKYNVNLNYGEGLSYPRRYEFNIDLDIKGFCIENLGRKTTFEIVINSNIKDYSIEINDYNLSATGLTPNVEHKIKKYWLLPNGKSLLIFKTNTVNPTGKLSVIFTENYL